MQLVRHSPNTGTSAIFNSISYAILATSLQLFLLSLSLSLAAFSVTIITSSSDPPVATWGRASCHPKGQLSASGGSPGSNRVHGQFHHGTVQASKFECWWNVLCAGTNVKTIGHQLQYLAIFYSFLHRLVLRNFLRTFHQDLISSLCVNRC